MAGLGDRADRFGPVHGKVLNSGLDLAEAAMEDDGERRVVDDGAVGRPVARVYQTRIFAEGRVPAAVVPVLDDPTAAVERQQPLGVGLFGGQRKPSGDFLPRMSKSGSTVVNLAVEPCDLGHVRGDRNGTLTAGISPHQPGWRRGRPERAHSRMKGETPEGDLMTNRFQ